jgi:signal transduction histidine kinase
MGKNDAFDRQLATLDELRRTERRVAVSLIASMIAHVVGTPLNVIAGRAGLIRKNSMATESVINDARCIEQKVQQLAMKVASIVEILSISDSTSNVCEVGTIVEEVVSLYEPIARTRGVMLRVDQPRDVTETVGRNRAILVLTSLLSLAVQEVRSGTTVECTVARNNVNGANASGPRSIKVGLDIPGCNFPDPRVLERLASLSDTDPESVNRMQVLGMCSTLLRAVDGSLDVRNTNQDSLITLLLPVEG